MIEKVNSVAESTKRLSELISKKRNQMKLEELFPAVST